MKSRASVKAILAWCLYDSGCASFSIIITTFIFSTYFTTQVAKTPIIGTYQWANAAAIAGIIVAILSPLFGAIADYAGKHKIWLIGCTLLCVLSTAMLWFVYPNVNAVYWALAWVILGSIGYETAQVFYNALLPDLGPSHYLGRISGWGWGCGYLGGILSLSLALILFVKWNVFALDTQSAEQIRIAGPFVSLWYGLFALPLFLSMPSVAAKAPTLFQSIRKGTQSLLHTLKQLPKEKNILLYLIAHMVYTDGLNTLFAFGGIYAAGTYGLSFEEVLVFGITMNITAGVGALLLSFLDDFWGSKATLMFSLVSLFILGLPILFLHDKYVFWACALLLCLFVGPIQSSSRSVMVRILGKEKASAEMFGLYALSGKITAFMGPWLLGIMTLTFNSQRVGMATLLIFFALGIILMIPVKVPQVFPNK